MITLKDWEEHCVNKKPLYFFSDCCVTDVPFSIAIAYDTTLETFVLCFSTWNITFNEIYTTKQECASESIKKILLKEGVCK